MWSCWVGRFQYAQIEFSTFEVRKPIHINSYPFNSNAHEQNDNLILLSVFMAISLDFIMITIHKHD